MEEMKSSTKHDDKDQLHDALDDFTFYDCLETFSESIESDGNPNPSPEDKTLPPAGVRRRRSQSHYKSSAADSMELSTISSSVNADDCLREREIRVSGKIGENDNKLENSGFWEIKHSSESPKSVLGREKNEINEEHSAITDANANARDDLVRDESNLRESDDANSSLLIIFAEYVYEWLKEHRAIWKLGLKCGWGLLWSAYVCAVLVGLLVSAFVMGGILIRVVVVEPIRMKRSLNFDYLEKSPVAFVPIITHAKLNHDMYLVEKPEILKDSGSRVVPFNHRLKVTLSLTLPESDYNQHLGVFQVRVDFLAADGKILATSRRPCMLQYRSHSIRLLLTLLKVAPILTGYASETQNLKINFRDFIEGEIPTACLRLVIEQRAEYPPGAGIPEIYTASLTLESELPLLKRILWFWKKTLFVWVSMSIFIMELVFALLCCRPIIIPKIRLREATNQDASQYNRPGAS